MLHSSGMRNLGLAICLAAAVVSACSPSSAPTASPAASAAASVPLSNADQPTVKGAGASATPAGQVAAPAEEGRTIAMLYREGHESAVLQALGLLVVLLVVLTLFTFGIPMPFRRRAVFVRADRSSGSRHTRAA